MTDDPILRLLEGLGDAIGRQADIMRAAATQHREERRALAAEYTLGLHDAFRLVAEQLYEVAAAPADQRQLVADTLVVLQPSDLERARAGEPLEVTP